MLKHDKIAFSAVEGEGTDLDPCYARSMLVEDRPYWGDKRFLIEVVTEVPGEEGPTELAEASIELDTAEATRLRDWLTAMIDRTPKDD